MVSFSRLSSSGNRLSTSFGNSYYPPIHTKIQDKSKLCQGRGRPNWRAAISANAALGLGIPEVRPYTVRRGDTIESISAKRGFEMFEIRKLNSKIDLSDLHEGQTLLLPAGKFSARDMLMLKGLEVGTDHRNYVVRNGERIDEIVKKRDISMKEVEELNPKINIKKLRGGDVLVLPERFSSREREAFIGFVPLEFLQEKPPFWYKVKRSLQKSHTKQMRPYTIRKGDTLETICYKRGLPIAEVKLLNKHIINLNRLQPGQTILLPGGYLSERDKVILSGIETGDVRHYPVRKGETLEDIISKRNIREEDVVRLNPSINFKKKLKPGVELLLPADKFTVREKEALQGTGTVPSEYFVPNSVVRNDFFIGLGVFTTLLIGALWALVKERKIIKEKLKKRFLRRK